MAEEYEELSEGPSVGHSHLQNVPDRFVNKAGGVDYPGLFVVQHPFACLPAVGITPPPALPLPQHGRQR